MKKRRKKRTHKRRAQAIRGRRVVIAALTASILYCGMLFFFTLTAERWGSEFSSAHVGASVTTGSLFLLGAVLAVYAFLGNPVIRALYLILHLLGALAGILWIGFQLAQGRGMDWLYFDLAGVGAAFFVCWVFFGAGDARAFFEEQEFHVKRT